MKLSRSRGKHKNTFEQQVHSLLETVYGKAKVLYESETLTYEVQETRKYTPDWKIKGTYVYVEGKGRFKTEDRKKMLLIKAQHPKKTFRFFFQSGNRKLYKGSNTTYGEWADAHGFEWTDLKKGIPKTWLPRNE